MEADWSVALAEDDPRIVVPWAAAADEALGCQFVDLRLHPGRIDELEEARSAPLRSALLSLNEGSSPVWTAKCDFWVTTDEPFDPYEMDAEPGETTFGAGCYIDVLPRNAAVRSDFRQQEAWMRLLTQRLRGAEAKSSRVELVLRAAVVDGSQSFGVSWFVQGCGGSAEAASLNWGKALGIALAVLLKTDIEAMPGGDTITGTGE